MQNADLILLNGASYEPWLTSVSLPESQLVDTSAGFKDKLIGLEERVTHSHGPEGKHEHAGTAFTTWLDLTLAVEQARSVKDALARLLPRHAPEIEGFEQLRKELVGLDAEISAAWAGGRTARYFSHPVYQYFARRYG
jgi:zinc transport system substrate-binding protein